MESPPARSWDRRWGSNEHATVQRPHAIGETPQAAAVGAVRAAVAVVLDLHDDQVAQAVDPDRRVLGVAVLADVGDRLGDDEVRGDLGRGGEAADEAHVDCDRHAARGGDARDRRVEAAVGQHRRVDAGDELAELDDRRRGLAVGRLHQLAGQLRIVVETLPGAAEIHRDRDEAGLGTVVEVALDALQLRRLHVGRGGPGAGEVLDPRREALPVARAEDQLREPDLDPRERRADPGRQHRERDTRAEHGDRELPGVEPLVPELGQRALRHEGPVEGVRDRPESAGPERERDHTRNEREDRDEEMPREVLPRLRVRRDGGQLGQHTALGRAVGARHRHVHQPHPLALDPGHGAVDVREREQERNPHERDQQADAGGEERPGDGERDDPHHAAEQEEAELAPGLRPHGPNERPPDR